VFALFSALIAPITLTTHHKEHHLLANALLATERHHAIQRRASRTALVRRLCVRTDESAPELAIALGLPMSLVAPLLRQLVVEGVVLERRERGTDAGRVLPRYRLDDTRLALIGAEVDMDRVRVVATSISGRVLSRTTLAYGKARSTMTCIDTLASALLRVCERLGADGKRVVGVGLGLPGTVHPDDDALPASFLRSRDIPFAALLARELEGSPLDGVPLFSKAAADAAALGEFEFGPVAGGAASLLYLNLDEELHAGIVIDGELLTDRRAGAGEVGHTVLQVDGPPCSCGRRGCARALISARSLLATDEPDPVKVLRWQLDAGAPGTLSAVERAGACLGTLLHNLVILYRPSRIVLGGPMMALGDALLGPARRALGHGGFACPAQPAALAPAHFGADAVAIGAAALARQRLTGRLEDATCRARRHAETARSPERFFWRRDLSIDHVATSVGASRP
jgi:predicted NBD/HSP70 family sugar kinase